MQRKMKEQQPSIAAQSTPASPDTPEIPFALRLGLPIALACLAAGLNVAAVRRQIVPTRVYAFAQSVNPGARLQAQHLQLVDVAGTVSTDVLVTPSDILLARDGGTELMSLEESLRESPRFVSRRMVAGELVSRASLGGRESIQPNNNEELIQVPRSLILGGGEELQPGQIVYFLAKKRRSSESSAFDMGPFRVALTEQDSGQRQSRDRQESIALIYRLDDSGLPTPAGSQLREAALSGEYSLTVIEKGSVRRTSIAAR